MLCPFCGTYAGQNDIVCPSCGKLLPRGENLDEGVRAIRQGRRARQAADGNETSIRLRRQGTGRAYVDPETRPESGGQIPVFADPEIYAADGRPEGVTPISRGERKIYGDTAIRDNAQQMYTMPVQPDRRKDRINRRWVNWMHVALWMVGVVIVLLVGAYLYLTRTVGGQRLMARMGYDATSAALWEVGAERMDTGDIDGAIRDFARAAEKDGDENVNVTGLLTLASAYEAIGKTAEAEEIYIHIYTDIVPSASDAYTNEIRILESTGRAPEAAVLMQTAYQKTGNNVFLQQRSDLLPSQPVADKAAGSFDHKIYLGLISAEGNDMYYTFDENAKLPEEGIHYTEPIFIDEGDYWHIRAVAVHEDLVSDELSAVYRVHLPAPKQPYSSLAPNTYAKKQRVWLRPAIDVYEDPNITIYYTIDGSTPDADSPLYTGEPFWLLTRYVTLKAVSVNEYGKASNTLEVSYKIEGNPMPKGAYTTEDIGSNLKLNTTNWDEFRNAYGEPSASQDILLDGFDTTLRRHTYPWGYATFWRVNSQMRLVELYCEGAEIKAPRDVAVGDTMESAVKKFRDMGQVESQSGNRGLYSNNDGTGKIFKVDNGWIVRYIAYTADGHNWRLDLNVNAEGVITSFYSLFIQ